MTPLHTFSSPRLRAVLVLPEIVAPYTLDSTLSPKGEPSSAANSNVRDRPGSSSGARPRPGSSGGELEACVSASVETEHPAQQHSPRRCWRDWPCPFPRMLFCACLALLLASFLLWPRAVGLMFALWWETLAALPTQRYLCASRAGRRCVGRL